MSKSIESKFYNIILNKYNGDYKVADVKSNPTKISDFDIDEFNELPQCDKDEYKERYLYILTELCKSGTISNSDYIKLLTAFNREYGWFNDELKLYIG